MLVVGGVLAQHGLDAFVVFGSEIEVCLFGVVWRVNVLCIEKKTKMMSGKAVRQRGMHTR